MRPINLEISGFGPYPDWVNIPFERFGSRGIFLITGDTGAGKTTIFDAITYALYGETSGGTRTGEMLRSDFAKEDVKTYVRLTFAYGKDIYTVKRNPKYARAKANGKGTTTENPNAELTLTDGKVITGNKQVTTYVKELMGIDYSQFTQIAMIAQGDFLRLLLAGSKERGEIFRRIFNTGFCQQLQLQLKSKMVSAKTDYKMAQTGILQYIQGIKVHENSLYYGDIYSLQQEQNVNKIDEITELLQKAIDEDKHLESKINSSLATMDATVKNLSLKITQGADNNEKLYSLKREKANLVKLESLLAGVEKDKQALAQAQTALVNIKPTADKVTSLQGDIERLVIQIKDKERFISEKNKLLQELYAKYLLQKNGELQRDKLKAEISKLIEEQDRYQVFNNLGLQCGKLQKEFDVLQKNIKAKEGLLDTYTKSVEGLKETLKKYDNLPILEEQLKNSFVQRQQVGGVLKALNDRLIRAEASKTKLEQAWRSFISLDKAYIDVNTEYALMESRFLQGQAGLLAATLQENTPCPVCGSVLHPNPAKLLQEIPDKEQLDKKGQEKDTAYIARQQASEMSGAIQARLDAEMNSIVNDIINCTEGVTVTKENCSQVIKSEIKNETARCNILREKKKNLREKQGLAGAAKEQLNLYEENLKELQQRVKVLTENIQKTLAQLEKTKGEYTAVGKQLQYDTAQAAKKVLNEKQKALCQLQQEYETAEKLYRQLKDRLETTKATLEENKVSLRENNTVLAGMLEKLNILLKENNFDSYDSYIKSLKTNDEIQEITTRINGFVADYTQAKSNVDLLTSQLKGEKIVDLMPLSEEKQNLVQCIASQTQNRDNIITRLNSNTDILTNIKRQAKLLLGYVDSYMVLKNLSETANGELSGKEKIAFEQYIQGAYFSEIIYEANKRFTYMSDGRYKLVRATQAENLRSQSGLELEVLDNYTGKNRSVKSLSGGEAFKASLSLALGLSDVIQRKAGGVCLDTMFVDEGFGSLDDQSLNQAVDILNQLTQGNRLVGIISHVSQLKENIDKKLIVRKNNTGSTVEIYI